MHPILTSTVMSITHCGTVSLRSMDSVSPPESRHNNLRYTEITFIVTTIIVICIKKSFRRGSALLMGREPELLVISSREEITHFL